VNKQRQAERQRRKRINRGVDAVLADMRRGQNLRLEFNRIGPRWFLSDGRRINAEVARVVIGRSTIVGAGDSLFPDAAPQTWRSTEVTETRKVTS
jgi:hypothetical protein